MGLAKSEDFIYYIVALLCWAYMGFVKLTRVSGCVSYSAYELNPPRNLN